MSLWSLLLVLHLVGLVLAVGAATVKLGLLLRSHADLAFLPVYLAAARPITRQIIVGQVLLTLTGIAWLVQGYVLEPRLILKLALFAVVWVLGPLIDRSVEPRFREFAPAPGEAASLAFRRVQRRYLMLEATATVLFYAIIIVWVRR